MKRPRDKTKPHPIICWIGCKLIWWGKWLRDETGCWLIEYWGQDRHKYGSEINGGLRLACRQAKDLNGRVLGECAGKIAA